MQIWKEIREVVRADPELLNIVMTALVILVAWSGRRTWRSDWQGALSPVLRMHGYNDNMDAQAISGELRACRQGNIEKARVLYEEAHRREHTSCTINLVAR